MGEGVFQMFEQDVNFFFYSIIESYTLTDVFPLFILYVTRWDPSAKLS